MVMEYSANGTLILLDREENVIRAESIVQPVAFNHKFISPEMIERQREKKNRKKERNETKEFGVSSGVDRNISR